MSKNTKFTSRSRTRFVSIRKRRAFGPHRSQRSGLAILMQAHVRMQRELLDNAALWLRPFVAFVHPSKYEELRGHMDGAIALAYGLTSVQKFIKGDIGELDSGYKFIEQPRKES